MKVIPNPTELSVMVASLFLNPPHTEIIIPPSIEPEVHTISFAVSFHTSGPKLLSTIIGDRNAAGVTRKKNSM